MPIGSVERTVQSAWRRYIAMGLILHPTQPKPRMAKFERAIVDFFQRILLLCSTFIVLFSLKYIFLLCSFRKIIEVTQFMGSLTKFSTELYNISQREFSLSRLKLAFDNINIS